MVSSRGKSKGCFATFAERKTRIKIDNRSSLSMETAILRMVDKYPLCVFRTSTVDRGKECYSNIEEHVDMAVYFADPYASWQRGTNENAIGLSREFFPKKTDLALITEEELEVALHLINHRPRKCLGWKTSYEALGRSVRLTNRHINNQDTLCDLTTILSSFQWYAKKKKSSLERKASLLCHKKEKSVGSPC